METPKIEQRKEGESTVGNTDNSAGTRDNRDNIAGTRDNMDNIAETSNDMDTNEGTKDKMDNSAESAEDMGKSTERMEHMVNAKLEQKMAASAEASEKMANCAQTVENMENAEEAKEKTIAAIDYKTMNLVERAYMDCRFEHLNVVNEFADADMFLVDGDSLLLELLSDVNLQEKQHLHLTYLAERFLTYFKDRGGKFQVVFFREMDAVWCDQPWVQLARRCLILHLRHNVHVPTHTHFHSAWSKDWLDFVDSDAMPAFIVLNDAECLEEEEEEEMDLGKEKIEMKKKRFIFRTQLLCCLSMGLNCCFSSGLEPKAMQLMGWSVSANPSHRRFIGRSHRQIKRTRSKIMESFHRHALANVPRYHLLSLEQANVKLQEIIAGLNEFGMVDCRTVAGVFACFSYLTLACEDDPPAAQAASQRVSTSPSTSLARLFLLHLLLVKHLPLRYRAQDVQWEWQPGGHTSNAITALCAQLELSMCQALRLVAANKSLLGAVDMKSTADICDGRLFIKLLMILTSLQDNNIDLELGEALASELNQAWTVVLRVLGKGVHGGQSSFITLRSLAEVWHGLQGGGVGEGKGSEDKAVSTPGRRIGLLPMAHKLVEDYAGSVLKSGIPLLDPKDPNVWKTVKEGHDFAELYHWHMHKPLSDDYDRTKDNEAKLSQDPWERSRQLRSINLYTKFVHLYGECLEGGLRKSEIIIVDEKTEKKKGKQKHAGGKEKPKKSKSAQIIEENQKKKGEKLESAELERWQRIEKRGNFAEKMQQGDFASILDTIDTFLAKCQHGPLKIQVLMRKAETLAEQWKALCSDEKQRAAGGWKIPVALLSLAGTLVQHHQDMLKDGQRRKLAKYVGLLGFTDIATAIDDKYETSGKEKTTSLPGLSSARFQLEFMGHLLPRDERKDPDPRVNNFIPDTWQRDLLDVVDNNQSALIVAPTSSGKTYASYYCIEKVLRDTNDGIVIYVSPTKALVNQVAATIYARFRNKKLPAGKSVYGVFTRDYRKNALNSQVLVTVPQCLEILMMSPRRQDWASKIRYVIFDEVHCLGSEIGAEVWEHLLLLIRCPFLALSATIGNPRTLHSWLQKSQDFRKAQDEEMGTLRNNHKVSYQVKYVQYDERHSDLVKSIYLPTGERKDGSDPSTESQPITETDDILHLHPCAFLKIWRLCKSSTFPADISLSPQETLTFLDTMKQVEADQSRLQALEPERFFSTTPWVSKTMVRKLEAAIKQEFMSWVSTDTDKAQQVINTLKQPLRDRENIAARVSEEAGEDYEGRHFVVENFVDVLKQLKEQDKLPVLVFSYDRRLCEDLVEEVVNYMEEKESQLMTERSIVVATDGTGARPKTEKTYKSQGDTYRKIKSVKDLESFTYLSDKGDRIAGGKERSAQYRANRKTTAAQYNTDGMLGIEEVHPECTFKPLKGSADIEELTEILSRLNRDKSENLIRGMMRGIAWHHSGLGSKERSAVEMLFRKRQLQVVVATGTLALGIHMPCKTVVFANDSVYLNALQYRQCSGRSGRRGFDLQGNVIFYGLPTRKVQRLMTAELPDLTGNFPITVSFVLRLMLMVTKSDQLDDAISRALTLLKHPLMCESRQDLYEQIQHHFLFSTQYLMEQHLLDINGNPQDFAGLATHLFYHEPSNFILVNFLEQGLFHQLCTPNEAGMFSEAVLTDLLLVLSHLFGRLPLHRSTIRRLKKKDTTRNSKVILEDLPGDFLEALNRSNASAKGVFDLYLRTVAKYIQDKMGEDITLPLSQLKFVPSGGAAVERAGLVCELQRQAHPNQACSAFAATSGHTDSNLAAFGSLISNVRHQVYSDIQILPIYAAQIYESNRCYFNRYILDFFALGSRTTIIRDNGLLAGDVFHHLKDFYLVLLSIKTSMTELSDEGDHVVQVLTQIIHDYRLKFNTAFKI